MMSYLFRDQRVAVCGFGGGAGTACHFGKHIRALFLLITTVKVFCNSQNVFNAVAY